MLINPTTGHEYVDNKRVAEALSHIMPVAKSLVVTNNLDYPTYPNETPRKQNQLPSIYGHRWYGVVFTPVENQHPAALQRYQSQLELQNLTWSNAHSQQAKDNGWTHFLIDKDKPYPKNIPIPPIYENAKYIVYTLGDLQ